MSGELALSFPRADPKVSVLIPAFNEAKTIASAIESVMLQRVDFDIEVIVIDDCSTDDTQEVLRGLADRHPTLRVLRNAQNSGKGFSVRRGIAESRGSYFHILDGDDCFANNYKLQRQVEFLDSNIDFFAVGHNTLVVSDNGTGIMSDLTSARVWSNADCVAGSFYNHTSSILYRKSVSELPEYFLEPEFRGDTALLVFMAVQSGLKFMYFPGIWSIYNFHGVGLWSQLTSEEQRAFNLRVIQGLQDRIVGDKSPELTRLLSLRKERALRAPATERKYAATTFEDILGLAERASSNVFKYREDAFKGMYAFRFVDELCEAAGRAWCLKNGVVAAGRDTDLGLAILLVSGLVPGGGGVFKEIKDLVSILLARGYRVGVVSTHKIPTEESIFEEHFASGQMFWWQAQADRSRLEKMHDVLSYLRDAGASLIFPFITHNDPIGSAALQPGLGARIIFDFVYDHGLSMAVLNSAIDTIVVKTVSQAQALAPMLPDQHMSLVPPFFTDRFGRREYNPMAAGHLVTASAAARSYKVEGGYTYSYAEIVPELLKKSGGVHIHFGPLSDDFLKRIREALVRKGLRPEQFRHIPWVDDFGGALIQEGVDLFIAPFPVCSARIAIEVMACAIPVVSHMVDTPMIPQGADFVAPQQFVLHTPGELMALVETLDADRLKRTSDIARAYFEQNNALDMAAKKLFALERMVLSSGLSPAFEMREFSQVFDVRVETPLFRRGSVSFEGETMVWGANLQYAPLQANQRNLAKVKFWHRTEFRRALRRKFHSFRQCARERLRRGHDKTVG